jgi:hypothetical protein
MLISWFVIKEQNELFSTEKTVVYSSPDGSGILFRLLAKKIERTAGQNAFETQNKCS